MKLLRTVFLLIVSVLCFNSFAMESDAKNTSMFDRALQTINEVGEWISETIRFSDDQPKAGDFFLVLVPDMKKMVWSTILKDCTMAEKVRRIGQLRRVCKNWNALLHNPKILKRLLPPFLYYKNSIGELLTKDSIAPIDSFCLYCFVNHSTLVDMTFREGFEEVYHRLLNGDRVGLVNVLIYGPPGTGKTKIMSCLGEDMERRGFMVRSFNCSILELYGEKRSNEVLTELFDDAKKSAKKTIIILEESEKFIGRDARASFRGTFLKLRSDGKGPLVILVTYRPTDIDEAILTRCNKYVQTEVPDFNERRILLKLLIEKQFKTCDNNTAKSSVFSRDFWVRKEKERPQQSIEEGTLSDQFLDELAVKTKGFTRRDISSLARAIFMTAVPKITHALINKAIDNMIKIKRERKGHLVAFA